MDQIRKIILYTLFALICLFLWQAWMQDQQTANQAQNDQKQTAASTPEAQSDKTPVKTTRTKEPSQLKNDKDQQQGLLSRVSDRSKWIHVQTDTLDIHIDPKGGNIVEGDLQKYFQTLHKKKPIQILSPKQQNFHVMKDGVFDNESNQKQALNFSAQQKDYELKPDQNTLELTLKATNAKGVNVYKTFRFKRGQYNVQVERQLVNNGPKTWQGHLFYELTRKKPESKGGYFRFHTFTGAAYSTKDTPYNKLKYQTIAQNGLDQQTTGGWIAFQQRYFLTAWIPDAATKHRYYAYKGPDELYTIGMSEPAVKLSPGEKHRSSAKFYIGPEIASYLKPLAKGLDLTVDYGWLWFISAAIFWVMKHIHQIVGNWGWSIVLVTVLIKLLFYKLSETSYRSMAKMRKLQPKLESLKEKYGDDRQKLGQATMELYRQEKVNPLGGCLPILVQIPVFIGLYWVLIESVQLRHAPFILWIHDLSARDPYFVLPILMGLSMFAQQKLSPKPPDPRQAKMMMFLPLIFTVFFMSFPAGLVLYWLVNNCLSIAQQWFIMRRMEQKPKRKSAS